MAPAELSGAQRGRLQLASRVATSWRWAIVGVLIVLLVIGLLSGGGSPSPSANSAARKSPHTASGHAGAGRHHTRTVTHVGLASLKLEPTGEVYVCLIGDGERKRIPGLILTPGSTEPDYHARRFVLTLGNDAVTLT